MHPSIVIMSDPLFAAPEVVHLSLGDLTSGEDYASDESESVDGGDDVGPVGYALEPVV